MLRLSRKIVGLAVANPQVEKIEATPLVVFSAV